MEIPRADRCASASPVKIKHKSWTWDGVQLYTLATLLLSSVSVKESKLVPARADELQTAHVISIGSSLTTDVNSTWVSRNGTFSMGFYPIDNKTYTLSIWYTNIPVHTVVWSANRNSLVIEGASLTLKGDGNLVLTDTLQTHPIWQSNTTLANAKTGELLETGNFVLRNTKAKIVWESFGTPSDTLLPGQKLMPGMQLVSSRSEFFPASGRYALRYEWDGNIRLYYAITNSAYWTAPVEASERSFAYLNFSGVFGLYNESGSTLASWMASDMGPGPMRRLTLGTEGDLRIYSWSHNLSSWNMVWKALSDECSVTDLCGPYGFCSYAPEPICSCPPNFLTSNVQDWSQGCSPPLPLNCSEGATTYKFLKLAYVEYAGSDYTSVDGISEAECLERCSEDCACLGVFYFYVGNGTCSLKSQQNSGRLNPSGNSFVKVNLLVNLTAYPPQTLHESGLHHPRQVSPQIVAGIVCSFALTIALLVACCYHWWKEAKMHQGFGTWNFLDYIPGAPTRFSFKDLRSATVNFSLKVGAGGFGTVYKGILPNSTAVAVKQLENSLQGETQFRTEVAAIGGTYHVNLVRLYGFCSEGTHRLLVYEFMANGSLDKVVFKDTNLLAATGSGQKFLDWEKRFKVLLGTAKAIAYLHEQCRDCIIHCDIKPENILLDEHFEAKVSDFGLAKLMRVGRDQSKALAVRGTKGYLAPEVLTNSTITSKSDVYSFGMVLLEVVTGRRNMTESSGTGTGEIIFAEWGLYRAIRQGRFSDLVDKNLGCMFDGQEVERTLKVSLWCVQDDPTMRPPMGKVVHMLEGMIAIPSPPIPKAVRDGSESAAMSQAQYQASTAALDSAHAVLEFDLNSPLISKPEG